MATIANLGLQNASSQNGMGVKIVATASTGTTVHTCQSGTDYFDEIWLWAVNRNAGTVGVVVQYGDTSTENSFGLAVPPNNAPIMVVPGWLLNNGKIVYAYATAANDVTVFGFSRHIQGNWVDQ